MSITKDLNWRYATKEFDSSKKVSAENLETILDALVLSASSFGLQPWKFVVVQNPELKEKLLPYSWNQRQVVDASHVIVFARPVEFNQNDVDRYIKSTAEIRNQTEESLKGYSDMMKGFLAKMPKEDLNHWMKNQIFLALGNLLTVVATLKIDACPMEGFSPADYDKVLELDKHGLASVVVCPIGYRSESDKYASLKKVRYSKDQLVLEL